MKLINWSWPTWSWSERSTSPLVDDTLALGDEWYVQQNQRVSFAILLMVLALSAFIVLAGVSFSSVGLQYGWLLGLGLFTLFFNKFFEGLSVSVTEWTGLVTTNYFTGNMRVYGPGLSVRLPWEQVEKSRYINLRLTERSFEEDFPTRGENDKEIGPLVKIKGLLQFRRVLAELPQHLGVDESAIEEALIKSVSEALMKEICKLTPAETRQEIEKLKKIAVTALGTGVTATGEVDPSVKARGEKEKMYGINILVATINDVEIDKSLQEAITNEAVVERYRRAANRLVVESKKDGGKEISFDDAMKTVLVSAERASLSIIGVQGQGADAAVATLKQIFGKTA